MKKTLFLMLCLASAMGFASCDRDEPQTADLTPSNASLYVGETTTLSYSGGYSTGSNQWKSGNPLIASVTSGSSTGYNGLVTALKVGTTNIYANEWVSSKITVLPRYTMYTEPFMNWSLSNTNITNSMGKEPIRKNSEMVDTVKISSEIYYGADNVLAYYYAFEKDTLVYSSMIIEPSKANDLPNFMGERYYNGDKNGFKDSDKFEYLTSTDDNMHLAKFTCTATDSILDSIQPSDVIIYIYTNTLDSAFSDKAEKILKQIQPTSGKK